MIKHNIYLSLLGYMLCCHISWSAQVEFVHSDYRRTSEYDPGTLRVFFKNKLNLGLSVRDVLLDDISIPVWGVSKNENKEEMRNEEKDLSPYEFAKLNYAHKRIIWARLLPKSLTKGNISVLEIKLRNPLKRTSKVSILFQKNIILQAIIRPISNPLVFSAIRFSEQMDKVYCFLYNQSDRDLEIEKVEYDFANVNQRIWFSSQHLKPLEKQAFIIELDNPTTPGTYHCFYVKTKDESSAADYARTLPFFPLTTENSTIPDGYGLDSEPFSSRLSVKSYPDLNGKIEINTPSVHIFDCAMHTFKADLTRSAKEILKRYDYAFQINQKWACSLRPLTEDDIYSLPELLRRDWSILLTELVGWQHSVDRLWRGTIYCSASHSDNRLF